MPLVNESHSCKSSESTLLPQRDQHGIIVWLNLQQSYILSDAVVVAGVENSPFVPLNERNKQRETAKWLTLHEVAVIPTITAEFFAGTIQPFIFQLIFYHTFWVLSQPTSPPPSCSENNVQDWKWTSLYPTLIKGEGRSAWSPKNVFYMCIEIIIIIIIIIIIMFLLYDKLVYMRVTVIRWPNMCRQLLRKMTANVFSITEVVSNLSWDTSAQQEKKLDWSGWEPNTIIDDCGVPKPTLVHEEIRHVLRHENSLFGMVDRFKWCPLKGIFLRMPLSSVKGVIISWWKKKVHLGAKRSTQRPGFVN